MKPFLVVTIITLHVVSSFQPLSFSPRVGGPGAKHAFGLNSHRRSKSHAATYSQYPKRKLPNRNAFHLLSRTDDEMDVGYSSVIFGSVAFFYWYLLVFGAAAEANGLPVPAFIPMVPGWPPSDQDLVPVIEDSIHFFYISDILNSVSGDQTNDLGQNLPQLRLAFFNFAEAWVFAFLPLLLADKNRLPLPVVLGTWFGALGLTNAFLTPYLAARQLSLIVTGDKDTIDTTASKDLDYQQSGNKALKLFFGLVATLVVGYAGYETILTTVTTPGEWNDFLLLVKNDRTYLAFAVDLVLFSFIQSFLLEGMNGSKHASDKIPFVGLISWLVR